MHSAKADASHSTQRAALNAVIYLFTQSLGRELEKLIFYCAITTSRLPAALTHEKFQQVLGHMSGTPRLTAGMLYEVLAQDSGLPPC